MISRGMVGSKRYCYVHAVCRGTQRKCEADCPIPQSGVELQA
jgi:hypothetical protein